MAQIKKTHAKLSASGAERWLNCPGSIKLSEGMPEQPESAAALEGTKAHECLEVFLHEGSNMGLMRLRNPKYPDEMLEHTEAAARHILTQTVLAKAKLLIEVPVDMSFISEDMGGTLDSARIEEFGTLTVTDFKYGYKEVSPVNNPQLIIYALGIAQEYDYNFDDVVLEIIQPRGGGINTFAMTLNELRKWEDTLKEGVAKVNSADPELKPGKWCHFCKARAVCPELSTKALAEARVDFSTPIKNEIALPPIKGIAPDVLGKTLQGIEKLETWIEAVKDYAFNELRAGTEIPGYKLVQKQGRTKWSDIESATIAATQAYGEKALTPSELLSPAQLKKLGAMAELIVDSYAVKESSGLTMVSADDKRPAFNQIEADFSEVIVDEVLIEKGDEVATKTKKSTKTKARNNTKNK